MVFNRKCFIFPPRKNKEETRAASQPALVATSQWAEISV